MATEWTPKAYQTIVKPWGDQACGITMANSRSKAQARSLASAQGVGYDLKWCDLRMIRRPEFDCLAEKFGLFNWDADHAARILHEHLTTTSKGGAE